MLLFSGLLTRGQPGIMMFPNLWFCLIRLVRCPVLLAFPPAGNGFTWFIKSVATLGGTEKVQDYWIVTMAHALKLEGKQ